MKNTVVFTALVFLMVVQVAFSQEEREYIPYHVGDFWVYHSDAYFEGNKPTTFRQEVEGIDQIGEEEYFRMTGRYTADDGSNEYFSYSWNIGLIKYIKNIC